MVKNFSKTIFGGVFFVVCAFFFSCGENSGLGSSIDTKSPTLAIDYPPSGVAIRDSFILAGSCSDDKSISRVLVTVKNLDTSVDYGSYQATVSPDSSSWEIELNEYDSNNEAYKNYNGYQYPDGKYEVSVIAYDNAGNNSGGTARTFEIDNTAPVFIISNPGVVKKQDKNPSAYGSIFTISGTISDNHTIAYMDVKIFNEAGEVVSSESYEGETLDFFREEEISTAGGSSVTIAQHASSTETAQSLANTRYSQLHPGDSGEEKYYAQITLTDSTQIYKNPPQNSSRTAEEIVSDRMGNSTSKLYLYDDVYLSVMSAKKGINSANGGFSATNLKDILSGIETGEKQAEALEILNDKVIDTAAADSDNPMGNKLYFSLNPMANPTYTVNGFGINFNGDETTYQTASSGNSASVTISAGLDNTNIAPENVRVWLKSYPKANASGSGFTETAILEDMANLSNKVYSAEKDEKEFVEIDNLENISVTEGDYSIDGWILIYEYGKHNDAESSVSTKTFSVALPAGINLENYYTLAVTGKDVEDVLFYQDKVYGFEGNTAGVAPTVVIESPANLAIEKDSSALEFTGTAKISTSALFVKEIKAYLVVKNELTGETIWGHDDDVDSDIYDDKLSRAQAGESWTSEYGALTWDYENSKWKYRPSAKDGYPATPEGKIYLYTLTIRGISSSGHTIDVVSNVHVDSAAPVITMNSAEPKITESDSSKIYLNGIFTIKGNIEDQNLANVEYDVLASTDLTKTLTREDSVIGLLINDPDDKDLGKKYALTQAIDTSLISQHFATDENNDPEIQFDVVIIASDAAGSGNKTVYRLSEDTNLNENGKMFVLCQESDRPKIILGNASDSITSAAGLKTGNVFGITNNNTLQVSITDDDGIAEYTISIFNEDGSEAVQNPAYGDGNTFSNYPNKTSASINYLLPPAEGKYRVKIVTKDSGYKGSETSSYTDNFRINTAPSPVASGFMIAVDSGAPNVTITSPSKTSKEWFPKNKPVTVKGTVSKKNATTISGKALTGTGDDQVTINLNDDITITESGSGENKVYEWTGTFTPTKDGNYTISVTAIDDYDQSTEDKTIIGVDSTTPVWKADYEGMKFQIAKKDYAEGSGHTWYNAESLAFQGAYTEAEAGSGIESIYYKVIKAGETDTAPVNTDDFTDSFTAKRVTGTDIETFTANLGEFITKTNDEGAALPNYVYIMAVDNAGNKSDVKKFQIYIDKEGPTLESNKTGSQYSNKELPIDVTGIAADDSSGVESVVLTVTEDGQTAVKTTVDASSTDSFATWTATIPSDFLSGLEDKTYAVKATVTDKAGNSSNSTIFRIDVDTEKPVIKNLSLSDEGGTYSVYETKEKIDGTDKTVYYIHSGDNFLLSGSVQDSKSGIKSIVVNDGTNDIVSQINGKDVTALPVNLNLSSYASVGSVTLKITAIDNAGNTESQDLLVKIDNNAPVALHAIDEKQKDVFFRINENDNDDIETLTDLDKDVGGKYSEGTYGNSKTIKIRGTLSDTGSGAAMIYYKVFSETDLAGVSADKVQEELDKKADDFLKNYKTDKTGYFAPGVIASDAKRRVFYTGSLKNAQGESTAFSTTSGEYKDFVSNLGSLSGSTKSYATVESNYNSVLSGFSTGKNYLILVAVDNVGNAVLDSVTVGGTTYNNISLNVDETTPDASSSVEGLKYTNKTGTMEFSGTASDADSGLYSITLKLGTKEILLKSDAADGSVTNDNGTLSITKTDGKDKEWTWTATVNNDKFFAGASGTVSVSLEAKDCAGVGLTKSINVATVIIDTQLDSITLSAPTDADSDTDGTQVNGIITLTGTMEDTNVLPANAITKIEYKKTSDTAWTEASTTIMPNLALSESYTFKVEGFDTTKLSDNTEYQIRAVGTDSAGNEKASAEVSVKVSQDSDRPKANFNNIEYSSSLNTFLLKHGTDSQVTGRISDDDATGTAVVKKFIVSETEYKGAEGESEPANLLGTFLPSSGEFTITPSDTGDGEKTFYIYIEDNGGKKFYTTYTSASASATTNDKLQNPKILVKNTGYAEWDEKEFVYKSDSLNPTIGSGKGLPYSDAAAASVAKDFSNDDFATASDNSNLNASFIVGGEDRRYVKFYFTGRDASGIASMSATFTLPEDNTETTSPTLSTGDSWTGTQNETLAEWTTNAVDTRKWGTGQVSVSVTITDRVGNATTGTYSFLADNAAPTISITQPENGSHETQAVTIKGNAFDVGNADTDTIMWTVPTQAQLSITAETELKANLTWNSFMKSDKTAKNWEFDFDDAGLTEAEKTAKTFTNGNPLLDIFDNLTYATAVDGIYPLHIYFMAKDKIGNYTIKTDYIINHDPEGDRPKTTFSYPTTKDYAKNTASGNSLGYVTLGGTIRATGQSVIPYGDATAKEVYFQLVEETATSFTKDYVSGLKYTDSTGEHNAYTVVTATDILGSTVVTGITGETDATKKAELLRKYGFSSESELSGWWGIKANGSASWNFSINEHGELNPSGSEEATNTNNIKIRVCGVNSNNKFGAWSDGDNVIHIRVSSGVPQFTYTVAQFATAPTSVDATPTVEQPYTADMYLKGQWYIIVTATDDSQINEITATEGTSTVPGLVKGNTGTGITTVKMLVPMSNESGSHSYTVSAKDNTNNTSKMPFSVIIDNTAPTLTNIKSAEATFSDDANAVNSIQNYNSFFTLSGESMDSESGVEYVAFYYMREKGIPAEADKDAGTNHVIFDPIIPNGNGADAYSSARVKMGDLQERTITQGTTKYHLWAKKVSGTMQKTNEFTASADLGDHVRVGGLIEIGGTDATENSDGTSGVYMKITAISGKTVTFDGELTDTSKTTAYFPIAQVIDANNSQNTTRSNTGANVGKFVFDSNKDDGDGMPESFNKSGSNWAWDATIYSNNMPDGPVSLVVLVFDKAGNVNGKTFPAMVSNNAPRMAKVHLGTDLNHGGTYSDNEFETYNIVAKTGANEKVYTLTTAGYSKYALDSAGKWQETTSTRKAFTVKNKLAVLPEFVGGNGEIKLVFNAVDTATYDTDGNASPADGKQTGSALSKTGTISSTATDKHSIEGDYWELSDALGSDEEKQVSFTFWDSTEQTTSGTDSLYAFLRVKDLVVAQTDSVAPNVVVSPFEWKQAGSGTYIDTDTRKEVYKNNLFYAYTDTTTNGNTTRTYSDTVLGHIELEADLPDTFSATATSGEYDRDPKVSGKIIVRGTAYDETLLGSLSFSMTDFDGGSDILLSEYTNGDWTNKKTNAIGTNFYEVTVTDDYLNQDGHKVNWEIAIDTAHLTNTAKLDAVFTVIAKDQASTAHSSANSTGTAAGTTDATKHKPSYTMDVVPYITAIHTEDRTNSGLKDNNIRSASGKYSILKKSSDSENVITVEGFNFSTEAGKLVAKIAVNAPNTASAAPYGTTLASDTTDTAANVTDTSVFGLTITKGSDTSYATITNNGISKSGYLELFSNGVRTLNNLNNNNAHGSFALTGKVVSENTTPSVNDYRNMPNRVNEADFYTTKNVTLTDDRYLRVFDMKDTGIKNGYYPVMMMNGNNPVFGYVDLNGINSLEQMRTFQNQCYQPQRMEYDVSQGKVSYIEYLIGGLSWDQMAMARDTSGRYMHGSVYNYAGDAIHLVYNRYAEQHTWTYTYYEYYQQHSVNYTDGWGYTSKYEGYDGNKAESTENNAITLEKTNYGTNGTLIGRYQGMKLKVKGDSTSTAGAVYYMAYFDDNTTDKELIFRTFNIGSNNTSRSHQLKDGYTNLTEQATATTVTGRIRAATGATKYLDLGVTSTGYAVIVYYDKNGNLRLVHSDSPVDGSITGTTFSATNVEFTPYIGQYVSMAIDSSNHIHIAAFDANKSTLRYIYLESYSDTEPDEYIVDASTSVGKWTQIKIHPTSGKPYIAYYNNAEDGQKESIKLAYLSAAARADGYDADGYATGAWEYLTVPSLSPAQGGDAKFQSVCLDFDSANRPVVGYLGTNLEFGKWLDE